MIYNIKKRLNAMGRKQVALLKPLRERGFTVSPSKLSDALNERQVSDAYQIITKTCNEIVTMWEKQESVEV